MFEDDYFLRMVRRMAQALAAMLGAVAVGKHEEAEQALEDGYQAALGPQRGMLDLMDGESLARLIEDRERVSGLADLCDAEVTLRTQQGHSALAALRAKQAAGLRAALGPVGKV
jgi:hypothetical protein